MVSRGTLVSIALLGVLTCAALAADERPSPPVLPAGVGQDWWAEVQRQIRDEAYALRPLPTEAAGGTRGKWQASNPAHGFRATFAGGKVTLWADEGGRPTWELGLEPFSWGRPGRSEPLQRAVPSRSSNRVEYRRGPLTHWHLNEARGLEQGFTLPAPPAASGGRRQESGAAPPHASGVTSHEIFLDFALSGTLHPRFSEDGQAVDFYGPGAVAVLRLAGLRATDASGRELPARFAGFSRPASDLSASTTSGGLRITLQDAGARYPLTVVSVATTPAWVTSGAALYERYGITVATAGDVNGDGYDDILVGECPETANSSLRGGAYLFMGAPAGPSPTPAWTYVPAAYAYIGNSVAAAGDVNGDGFADVLVGNSRGGNGMAHLFLGSPLGLSSTPDWTATGEVPSQFGFLVAPAGDVNGDGYSDVLIATPYHPGGGTPGYGRGKAYVYIGGASGLASTPCWTAWGLVDYDYFGCSAATAGDVNGDGFSDILVGAMYAEAGGANRGEVFLYLGSPAGPSATADWSASGAVDNSELGRVVSSAGDIDGDGFSDVAVSARYGWSGELGMVCLYRGSPAGLPPTPDWSTAGVDGSIYFGSWVAPAGDVDGDGYSELLVGNPVVGTGGTVYLFGGSATGLGTTPDWTASGEASGSYFGLCVSPAGDTNGDGFSDILVGAYGYATRTGRAYLYLGGPSGPAALSGWGIPGAGADQLGFAVALVGDVDGDGFDDIAVGAAGPSAPAGRVYLFPGAEGGPETVPAATLPGESPGDAFGAALAAAGDVDGDGYGDILIGAPRASTARGRAYLYRGGSAGLALAPSWTAEGGDPGDAFGSTVMGAGDVDGDGFAEVAVGAPARGGEAGAAYLYRGGASGLSSAPMWMAAGESAGDRFGESLSGAGDVDRDGYGDLAVGAPGAAGDAGRVYLYPGSGSGLSGTASWTFSGGAAGDAFGAALSRAGDTDGDGYSDLLVGAGGYGGGAGLASLFLGGAGGLSPTASWTAVGEAAGDGFGRSVAAAGDADGDGFCDVAVGAPGSAAAAGKAYLYRGSAAGLSTAAAWTAVGGEADASFGGAFGGAGDVDGDGFCDLLVGASGSGGGAGSADLFYGGGGPGRPLAPRQFTGGGGTPIAPLGRTEDGLVRLRALGRSPFGRGGVKLQWQAAALGWSFSSSTAPLWQDGGLAGAALETILFLPQEGPYIWRVRTLYQPATTPFQSHGRWGTLRANGPREADLRRRAPCAAPDQPCTLTNLSKDGTSCTLTWEDANDPGSRTGWNVRRSADPAPAPEGWPVLGADVADQDAGTPGIQWTDSAGGDPSPGTAWFYQVTPFNGDCPAEGPF